MPDDTDDGVLRRINVREPAIAVLEAELLASRPERVLEWLRSRANGDYTEKPIYDASLEKSLLGRNDPLINLGLAQFGIEDEILRSLFDSPASSQRSALRLAVLSNTTIRKHQPYHSGDLIAALTGTRGEVGPWLASLSDEELRALFLNPTLGNEFLLEFLERKKGWSDLSEPRQILTLYALANNPRMSERYKSITMDGYAEYSHDAVFTAAWNLAAVVPVKLHWCWVLTALYPKTLTSVSVEDPLALAKRWFPDPADEKVAAAEEKRLQDPDPGSFGYLRMEIARLAVRKNAVGTKLADLLNHEDLAIRLGACRYGNPDAEQIAAAAARDPKMAFASLVRNPALWRTGSTREILKKLAWDQPDPRSYMDSPNMYKHMEAQFRAEHPEWFEDEDREPVDEKGHRVA
jgi:hypothetical protein